MNPTELTQIAPQYATTTGSNKNGQVITTLYKTHAIYNGSLYPLGEPTYIKLFEDATPEQLQTEMTLNDWARWNTELIKDKTVEVSENVYYQMLECLPPRNWRGHYFEVGEPNHHNSKGQPVHRAFWMDNGKYFTGYPTTL